MHRLFHLFIAGLVAVIATVPVHAQQKIRVVASTPDLKSLTEAVGGDRVDVESLARGWQNFHDVEVRPSLMVKLRRADVLVMNGLDLDFWVDSLVQGANNPRLLPGAPGRIDASRGVTVQEIPTGRVDRSMGDVHPLGNPHYTLDPETAPIAMANILDGLARLTPEHRELFDRRREEFLGRLRAAQTRWQQTLDRFKGAKVVVYHNTWIYFLSRFGLIQAGTIEDRPGIPPSPAHLATLVRQMKDERIRVVVLDPWGDRRLAERLAADAGAQVIVLAHTVGAVKGTDSYLEMIGHNVNALARALGAS
jgi:zinc/manganese transport system substrate-binding protein